MDDRRQTPAHVTSRVFAPEELVAVVRHANLRATQLGAAGLASTLAHVRCPQVSLDMLELGSPMLFEGAVVADHYTITVIIRCPTPGHSYNFAGAFADGYIGFYPPGGQTKAMIPQGYANATLTIPGDHFRRAVDTCFPELPAAVLRHGAGMKVPAPEFRAIRQLVEIVRMAMADSEQPLASPLAMAHLEADLLATFLTALRKGCGLLVPPPVVRIGRRYQLLARAWELLDAHLTEPMPVDRLCAELGLSRRSLEYMFNDLLGIGPIAYLRLKRLNGVRTALVNAEPRHGIIKRLALDFGFWHLGHFAKDYRELFGENPSRTLAKQSGSRPYTIAADRSGDGN